jgi:uncharacterized protein with LGFP repeats
LFDAVRPTPVQVRTVGRLLGWRLAMDGIDPHGRIALRSDGGSYTYFSQGAAVSLPRIFSHRDVGNTDCPGDLGYGLMDEIRDIAAQFNKRPRPKIWRTGYKVATPLDKGRRWPA